MSGYLSRDEKYRAEFEQTFGKMTDPYKLEKIHLSNEALKLSKTEPIMDKAKRVYAEFSKGKEQVEIEYLLMSLANHWQAKYKAPVASGSSDALKTQELKNQRW